MAIYIWLYIYIIYMAVYIYMALYGFVMAISLLYYCMLLWFINLLYICVCIYTYDIYILHQYLNVCLVDRVFSWWFDGIVSFFNCGCQSGDDSEPSAGNDPVTHSSLILNIHEYPIFKRFCIWNVEISNINQHRFAQLLWTLVDAKRHQMFIQSVELLGVPQIFSGLQNQRASCTQLSVSESSKTAESMSFIHKQTPPPDSTIWTKNGINYMFSHVFTNPKEDCSCSSFQATNEPTLAKQLKSAWDLGRRSEKGGDPSLISDMFLGKARCLTLVNHRIGWWENLQETPIFDGKNHGFRLRFSLKPIQWVKHHRNLGVPMGSLFSPQKPLGSAGFWNRTTVKFNSSGSENSPPKPKWRFPIHGGTPSCHPFYLGSMGIPGS